METRKRESKEFDQQLPAADTGNASNPTPHENTTTPADGNQLLGEKAETYLRESANIEDLPDPQQEQEADELLDQEDRSKQES